MIFARNGQPVRIAAHCGVHHPFGNPHALLTLVQVEPFTRADMAAASIDFIPDDEQWRDLDWDHVPFYQWAYKLRATHGFTEIAHAVKVAPPRQLTAAFNQAA